ncbi:MAG: hypothetical protein K9L78_05205 [Victivallales bacterium]|nr:hypothetical protein [Victivallales bacterium]MCF7889499.1 hypothetical protein [Victivallales bacterium]
MSKLTKRTLVPFVLAVFMILANNLSGKADFSAPKTFTGIVEPLSTVDIYGGFDNEYKGIINYVPRPGALFRGPILDKKGNIVKKGDILVKMDTTYRDAQVRQAKATVRKDKALLDSKKSAYLRNKKLIEKSKGAISEQKYLDSCTDYLQARAQLESDKAALILAEKLRSTCTIRARFDGVVNKVNFPGGYLCNFGAVPTLTVSQLVPMGINIKMSRDEAFAVNVDTPISIYPLGKKEPVGVYKGYGRLTDEGIQVITGNHVRSPETMKLDDGREVPVINKISAVANFNRYEGKNNKIGINTQTIGKDDKGTFVYKIDRQKTMQPAEKLNPVMNLKKVYIKVGNEVNPIESSVQYISVKPVQKGELTANDLLIKKCDFDKLKDGNRTLYYIYERYLFMPGDHVKVVIGGKPRSY